MHAALRSALLLALLAVPVHALPAQQAFSSPDEAVAAFIAALGTRQADATRLAALLGDDWNSYIPLEGIEREDVEAFLALYRERHEIRPESRNRSHLVVGTTAWELPLPLVRGKDGWFFDTRAGGETIRIRRIGRNELTTLQAVRAYHDAQMDYAEVDRDGDGTLEYAQKFASSEGRHDGLYWAEAPGEEESPLGPLFGDELPDGDWHGYRYRILTAQGPSAPGGSYDYLLGDNMSRGFALIAWPSAYGDSGVMSFMISHDGVVFEKDLGPDGSKQALAMTRFDPDSSWREVAEGD
ncbi:DUF2950 domain-containing protein [Pseudomonas flexibilis]|uniref:DUF2950 domain-containing protein n=1 Tax=Pseudomonas flexibilis TaxID=706570 RepID=A0A0B3BSS3_9PSED|nr:DUF2950 domain-containing protein [Pseudomonas flexibilis]KHO63709.1 hypothetical protein PT85_14470 [Pseudomonas flexibilis]SCY28004.1 Protein of unknown function [Pseudomonas flexibilis]